MDLDVDSRHVLLVFSVLQTTTEISYVDALRERLKCELGHQKISWTCAM